MRCADCGRWIEKRRRGKWAAPRNGGGYSYACRTVVREGVIVAADYHYVVGETQQHFPAVLDTVAPKVVR